MIKCSIITICYNNCAGLRRTVESVVAQSYKDYEFIVIDGGSTDGSADVIKEYSSYIAFGVSEKDSGIYNAMNKGTGHATGEYCLYLNSGDYFSDSDALLRVFSKGYCEEIIYGDVIRTRGKKKKVVRYPDTLTTKDFCKRSASIHHQAAFIKRDLLNRMGGYREDLYLSSDWHFFFNAVMKEKASTRHIRTVVSVCDALGRSNAYASDDPRIRRDKEAKDEELKAYGISRLEDGSVGDKFNICDKLVWNISPLIPLSVFIKLCK